MKKAILASLVIAVGCLGLWFFGRPAYRHYEERRALERAKTFLAKGDYRNASLSARQTLQVNPLNLEACELMADLAEKSRSPYVLDWRRRIVEVAPTLQNKLQLAAAALHAQAPPYPLAAQTLDELKDAAAGVAAYHALAAELALRLKRPEEAVAQFEQASRLEPTNELPQLNLAVLHLQSTNAGAASAARATLERLRASTNVGTVALRWLVAESLDRNDLSSAERFSRQLLADAHAAPDDRLQHLTILQRSNNPEFKPYLAALERNSLTNAAEVYGISTWMVGHGLVGDALAWVTGCPAKLRAEQPVPLALVDCYVAKKDWRGLDTSLQEQKWGDREFLRFAFLSRSAAELNQKLAADSRWHSAIREADERLGPLTALMTMATTWGRDQAREDLLWQIAQRFPRERWALRELERLYLAAGNTHGLNKVYSTLASYTPNDLIAQNNLAATSLLLRLNLSQAHALAKEVFTRHPKEAIVPSTCATYAFSLHLQGRTKEGLGVLEKLKPDALETPSVALYYGLLLSASGETNKAGKYLALAQKADLLPEEKALAAEAVKKSSVTP
jgi:predicted Zn-dependent protease